MKALKLSTVLALLIFTAVGRADPLDAWTLRNQDPEYDLLGIAYGNGQFVAVGNSGAIMTSTDDGVTWVRRESGTTSVLWGIAYGNGQFAAFGVGPPGSSLPETFAFILTSTDGVNWV